ncbi:MAG: Abi family protein [Burkholderiales bacterium]|nr:Abi family protein [Burkholderiales bacterium]MBP9768773.1 Abi family protein [Burkholderiales bacterium]
MSNTKTKSHATPEHKNIYTSHPSSVDGQISILRQRGMLIDDYAFAKDFLEEVYFHRLLSYSVPFFINGNPQQYQPGTKFSDVVKVYEFDSKLRLLILEAIEKIEISVRTQFINLSWKYGPHFYLDYKLFKDHKLLNDSIERIQYQLKVSRDLLVSEYYHRYHDPEMPPVWIAIELTTIGQLSKWLRNLKQVADKESIARRYKLHFSLLQSILDNLTLIRNYSAHHTRIWNRHFDFECILDEQHDTLEHALCEGSRIYSVLLLMLYVLKTLGIEQPFYQHLVKLIEVYDVNIAAMGFPENWQANFQAVIHAK